MKILITGGAGFIGSYLVELLFKKGFDITILDNFSPQIHGLDYENSFLYNKIKNKARIIKGNIQDAEIYNLLENDFEYIVHLAAETGTGQSMYQIKHYTDVNVSATALLLEKLVLTNKKIKRIVVSSSRAIYGEGKYMIPSTKEVVYPPQRENINMAKGIFEPLRNGEILSCLLTDENAAFSPSSVYGITKLSQEQLITNVAKSLGIESVALRFQNVYGPGQSLKNPYTGILSIFSTQLLQSNPINIFEDGKESRDFVYISDVVDSIYLALTVKNVEGIAYNIGTGIGTTVNQVAELLKEYYNSDSEINITGNYRVGDIRHNKADITKAQQELGYDPKISFQIGLKKFTEWVLTQELEENNYAQSLEELKQKGLFK